MGGRSQVDWLHAVPKVQGRVRSRDLGAVALDVAAGPAGHGAELLRAAALLQRLTRTADAGRVRRRRRGPGNVRDCVTRGRGTKSSMSESETTGRATCRRTLRARSPPRAARSRTRARAPSAPTPPFRAAPRGTTAARDVALHPAGRGERRRHARHDRRHLVRRRVPCTGVPDRVVAARHPRDGRAP